MQQQLTWPKNDQLFLPKKTAEPRPQVPEHCLRTFEILDEMIHALGEAGVDTSYFPQKATDVLRLYSIKLTPQPGSTPTPFALYESILDAPPTLSTRIKETLTKLFKKE